MLINDQEGGTVHAIQQSTQLKPPDVPVPIALESISCWLDTSCSILVHCEPQRG